MIQTITKGGQDVSVVNSLDMTYFSSGSYENYTLPSSMMPFGGYVRGSNNMMYLKSSGGYSLTFTLPQNAKPNSQVRFDVHTDSGSYGAGNYTLTFPDTTSELHTFVADENYTWLCNASAGDVLTLTTTDSSGPDIVSVTVTHISYAPDTVNYVNDIIKVNEPTLVRYEILDEIHCPDVSDSPSYIDTEYSPNINTEIEIKYKCNGNFVEGNNQRIFYLFDADWNATDQWQVNYENNMMYYNFNSRYFDQVYPTISWDNTTPHILWMSHTELLYDSSQIATNSNSFYPTTKKWGISSTSTEATGDQSTFSYYYCKIYESGTLVHNFLPVKRLSDNTIGFYDTVTSTFHDAVGTFVGTSKSTPEYIDTYVRPMIHINKIYHNGVVYWGNI